jgi:uncharacterized protein YegL
MRIGPNTLLNPTNHYRRCLLWMILDASDSMSGAPISALNAAIPLLKPELLDDPISRGSLQLGITACSGSHPQVIQPWTDLENFSEPRLKTSGGTPLAESIINALEEIRAYQSVCDQQGVAYYSPLLWIFTDGEWTDTHRVDEAVRVAQAAQQYAVPQRVLIFALTTSQDPQAIANLNRITQRTFLLEDACFREMIVWLKEVTRTVTHSRPGGKLMLPEPPSQITLANALTIET